MLHGGGWVGGWGSANWLLQLRVQEFVDHFVIAVVIVIPVIIASVSV